ncbi:bacterial transcriptional activator domain-containing protein [Streptomyces sp. NBC_00568]|nr:bacterial transcriptional activator domain-containing protein [Streptomyces sp. NBC_00568]
MQINGISGSSHRPREAQLAALLHSKPGRSADTLCSDMDPLAPWTKRTLNSRTGDLCRALSDDPHGNPYVPRRSAIDDPYVISEHVLCDWDKFQALAEQTLLNGPSDVAVLETALGLVRGRPFGAHLLPWIEAHAQEMITRIIDVAHTVAQWRTVPGPDRDLVAARQTVSVDLKVDNSAKLTGSGSSTPAETARACTPASHDSSKTTGPSTHPRNWRLSTSSRSCWTPPPSSLAPGK